LHRRVVLPAEDTQPERVCVCACLEALLQVVHRVVAPLEVRRDLTI
jgi:hypothetical protein